MIERVRARSTQPVDAAAVRHAAVRAGAPVAASDADRAAGELLAALAHGRAPRTALRSLLADALGEATRQTPSDSARAAAGWVAASARERGEALRDLLLLADRLPPPRTRPTQAFPHIASGRA